MFKLIGWFFKASLSVLVILIASHLVKWNGKTVSDQVRATLSSAEKSPVLKTVKKKSTALVSQARDAADHALQNNKLSISTEIPALDKVKLQALIHEGAVHHQ